MKVEYEFDNKMVVKLGYTPERIAATVKRIHAKRHLPCIEDGDVLAFSDTGRKEDYSNLWICISRLINSDWFLRCATALRWFDENDDEEFEDVLAQADLLDRKGFREGVRHDY